MGRRSSVGIATRYGLDGQGIESRWGHPSRPALGSTQPPIQWVPGIRRPGRGADHPPPSKRRGHERVELYLYSPSASQWPVIGWTFTVTCVMYLLRHGFKYCKKFPFSKKFCFLLFFFSGSNTLGFYSRILVWLSVRKSVNKKRKFRPITCHGVTKWE